MRNLPSAHDLLTEAQLRRVRARSNMRGVWCVLHAWVVIAAAMATFAAFPNPITFLIAVAIIGSRQLGLLILMHDGAHGLLTDSRRLNDVLSQWLCAFPPFAETFIYRRYHLQHHSRTLQPDDPDLILTGHYPITRASLRRKLWRDLSGQTGFSQRRQQFASAAGNSEQPIAARVDHFFKMLGRQLLANAILLAICIAVGHWYLYPALWLLPLLTWQQLALRVRNIAEHAVLRDANNPFRNARTTEVNWLERIFLAPYWVNYHLEHHLMMWVPCYRLPLARKYLLANGYGRQMETAHGYREVLRAVTVDSENETGPKRLGRAVGTFSDGFQS